MQNPYIFLVLLAANMIYLKLGKLLKTSNNFLWQNNILSTMMVDRKHTITSFLDECWLLLPIYITIFCKWFHISIISDGEQSSETL